MTNLSTQNRDNIKEIKNGLLKHFEDDEKEFDSINKKLDAITKEKNTTHKMIHEELKEIKEAVQALSDKVSPVVTWFGNINFSKKAIMWILGILGSIVGIALGVKNLLK